MQGVPTACSAPGTEPGLFRRRLGDRARGSDCEGSMRSGAVPILVGGTGLYMRTLLDGIAPVPAIDPAVRAAVRAMPVAEAYAALLARRPGAAPPGSPPQTAPGLPARWKWCARPGGPLANGSTAELSGGIGHAVTLHTAVLLPPRDWLYERCDRRFAHDAGTRRARRGQRAAGPRTRPRSAGECSAIPAARCCRSTTRCSSRTGIRHILVRHEQGAAHAAEGYARSTGKVGVVLVTSGPGATNA
jgi:hypothetical protein